MFRHSFFHEITSYILFEPMCVFVFTQSANNIKWIHAMLYHETKREKKNKYIIHISISFIHKDALEKSIVVNRYWLDYFPCHCFYSDSDSNSDGLIPYTCMVYSLFAHQFYVCVHLFTFQIMLHFQSTQLILV